MSSQSSRLRKEHGGGWSRAFPRQVHDRFAPPRLLLHDARYISRLAHMDITTAIVTDTG